MQRNTQGAEGHETPRRALRHTHTGQLRVTKVRSSRDRREFVALPRRLYARDSRWVGPQDGAVKHQMDARRNPFAREAFIEHFIARDSHGRCVGRIAATLHPAHARRHGCKAFFGHFESEDDPHVAQALLGAVEAWAADRGVGVIQGPCTYAMTQEAGLLVSGFEHPSVVLQGYNPPHYLALLEASGYEPAFHMSTFTVSRDSERVTRTLRVGETAASRLGLSARTIDMRCFDRELERIRLCYNAAFAVHPETVRISRAVFADQAREMKGIVDPRLIRILEAEGQAVAFAVAIPNVNEVLAATQGRVTLSLALRFKELMARVRSMVVVMIGAAPFVGTESPTRGAASAAQGIGTVLAGQIGQALFDGGYYDVHTTWIHDANWRALTLMRAIGAKPLKRYAIVQRELS